VRQFRVVIFLVCKPGREFSGCNRKGSFVRGIAFPETRAYVERVEDLKRIYRKAYGSRLRPAPT